MSQADPPRDGGPGDGIPAAPRFLTRGPHPWRLAGDSDAAVAFERSLFDAGGRPLDAERELVDFAGTGLPPALRLALAGFVLLGKLSPADLRALADEVREARRSGFVKDFPGLLAALGPASAFALDDPMDGVLTGPLQRALAGRGTSLLAALEHVCTRPDPRDVLVYFDVFVRSRRGILALALRLARELPPFPAELLDGSVEVFSWWRERGTREVALEVAGERFTAPLPVGLPAPVGSTTASVLAELLGSLRRDAERLAHPARDFSGVPGEIVRELLDGLAGLLLNGLCRERTPRPDEIEASLGPAGALPTRARHARFVTIAGAPFHDALGRFFAAPSRQLDLPRTRRCVAVWRTGTCPFALAGWSQTIRPE